ncbi:unnamed protein product [Pleuronectes platessa]|uniref:Uncharacterized protein n=1 Tax=Pleuronectes platessa TaxID=8262 RepID=A0A9N7U162_PLEPL|nr:unnamed protein product [Pleuronectes platessa]
MPGVFPLNGFSQPNAHSRLPRDLLTAPFSPPSLSPLHLFHLRLYATPQNRPPTLLMLPPPHHHHHHQHTHIRPQSSSCAFAHIPWANHPWQQQRDGEEETMQRRDGSPNSISSSPHGIAWENIGDKSEMRDQIKKLHLPPSHPPICLFFLMHLQMRKENLVSQLHTSQTTSQRPKSWDLGLHFTLSDCL